MMRAISSHDGPARSPVRWLHPICIGLLLALTTHTFAQTTQPADATTKASSQPMATMANCPMNNVACDPAFAPGLPVSESQTAKEALAEGDEAFSEGRIEAAAASWAIAVSQARASHDEVHYCEASRRLAGAYQSLGNYRLAYPTLARALLVADSHSDDEASMHLCTLMGSVLTFSRPPGDDPPTAAPYLARALSLAQKRNDPASEAAALIDEGSYQASLKQTDAALGSFDQAATKADAASQPQLAACARCNAALVASHAKPIADLQQRCSDAAKSVEALDDSVEKATRLISLGRCAQVGAEAAPTDPLSKPLLQNATECYQRAVSIAAALNDARTSSFAWGYLGNLYELHGGDARLGDALAATHRARFFAQSIQRPDALYRWEWQSGRILSRQGEKDAAITAYNRALASLQEVRDDVALSSATDFRKNVGSLFYELADLLLQRASKLQATDPVASQQSLQDARATVEQLKATELKNYFQDECVHVAQAQQKDVDAALNASRRTAILYVIPLETRTEVLLSLPPDSPSAASKPVLWQAPPAPVGRAELYRVAGSMRKRLVDPRVFTFRQPAAKLYDWLIRPSLPQLTSHDIDTIVFVPDGDLRRIPPAALYDSKTDRFLVEDFAVAITPGLTLVAPEPIGSQDSIRLLAAGLSEGKRIQVPGGGGTTEDFGALPGVPAELRGVEASYINHNRTLPNAQFRQDAIRSELDGQSYSIVHLATHAQFDEDSRKTFILADDGPLDLNQLEQMIEPSQFRGRPVELLTLSACETAAGNEDSARAALGLAGVAVRAGARSALATLWLADDAATSRFMPDFYRYFSSAAAPSKAQALRQAQLQMLGTLRYRHPRFWAPFVIIGNWR